jgi:hypothetical protein
VAGTSGGNEDGGPDEVERGGKETAWPLVSHIGVSRSVRDVHWQAAVKATQVEIALMGHLGFAGSGGAGGGTPHQDGEAGILVKPGTGGTAIGSLYFDFKQAEESDKLCLKFIGRVGAVDAAIKGTSTTAHFMDIGNVVVSGSEFTLRLEPAQNMQAVASPTVVLAWMAKVVQDVSKSTLEFVTESVDLNVGDGEKVKVTLHSLVQCKGNFCERGSDQPHSSDIWRHFVPPLGIQPHPLGMIIGVTFLPCLIAVIVSYSSACCTSVCVHPCCFDESSSR